MSLLPDVAYLDSAYIVHAPRQAVLLRMCLPCWEDSCHCCHGGPCICACREQMVPWCGRCLDEVTSLRHAALCEPELTAARVHLLADTVGRTA